MRIAFKPERRKMEIRSLEVDIDKGILKLTDRMLTHLQL